MNTALKDYNYKMERYENVLSLFNGGGASLQDLKDAELVLAAAENAMKDARQGYEIAKNSLDKIRNGASKYGLEAAEANVEQARLQLEELENSMGRTSVLAGIKGVVLARYIEKGEFVQPGMLMYEIGDYNSAYLKVETLADDAGKIKIGRKAVLSGEVLEGREVRGEVFYIAPKADTRVSSLGAEQQRIEVRISFDNSSLGLKPGYGVDVGIITDEKPSALFVPDKAVFDVDGKDGVFIEENGRLALKEVTTGIENEAHIDILVGLSEGDRVVVDPENSLKPGIRIK